jgi:hypothetical protein
VSLPHGASINKLRGGVKADRRADGDQQDAISAFAILMIADVFQKGDCLTAAAAGGVASRCFFCPRRAGTSLRSAFVICCALFVESDGSHYNITQMTNAEHREVPARRESMINDQ